MISSSSSRPRFLLARLLGPLLPADMLGRNGELATVRCALAGRVHQFSAYLISS